MSEAVAKHRIVPPMRGATIAADTQVALTGWLRKRFDDPDLAITSMASPGSAGVNNETLILSLSSRAPELRDLAGLVVRLEPPTTLFAAVDISLHYRLYRTMQDEPSVPSPRVFGFEEDISVLGRRFFVMERLEGLIPSDNPPYHQSGWLAELAPDERAQLWRDAIGTMARMHRLPVERFAFLREHGLGGLAGQIAYLRTYFDDARAGRDYPLIERAWEWLQANVPDGLEEGFSWGDARCVNMLFEGTRCVGVLDWDMVSLVGAEADLGWWLVHDWVSSAGIGRLSGLPGPVETVRIWEDAVGRQARNMEFWLMFNLFRLGGIMILLKRFLMEGGTPAEAVADIDWRNPAMSILQSRFGSGQPMGMGTWADLWPAPTDQSGIGN